MSQPNICAKQLSSFSPKSSSFSPKSSSFSPKSSTSPVGLRRMRGRKRPPSFQDVRDLDGEGILKTDSFIYEDTRIEDMDSRVEILAISQRRTEELLLTILSKVCVFIYSVRPFFLKKDSHCEATKKATINK